MCVQRLSIRLSVKLPRRNKCRAKCLCPAKTKIVMTANLPASLRASPKSNKRVIEDRTIRKPETAMLSKESLAIMLEHFPEIRREAGIPTTQSEIDERAALARMQDSDRQKLEQAHAQTPSPQADKQHAERDLLDHQHLAEQVGVQAKWIAQHLNSRSPAEAGKYKAGSRRALHTAHFIYEQRQHSGAAKDRSRKTRAISSRTTRKNRPIRKNPYTKARN